jgi:hypothetical protein
LVSQTLSDGYVHGPPVGRTGGGIQRREDTRAIEIKFLHGWNAIYPQHFNHILIDLDVVGDGVNLAGGERVRVLELEVLGEGQAYVTSLGEFISTLQEEVKLLSRISLSNLILKHLVFSKFQWRG